MKKFNKYIIGLLVTVIMAGSTVSCMDTLREEFYNPDKVTEPMFPLFFASAISQSHLFRYEYGPSYHYLSVTGRMLGIGNHPYFSRLDYNNNIIQTWGSDWSGGEFNKNIFEKTNVQYSKDINAMKLLYEDMTDIEREANAIYLYCSDIIQGYAFQRSTDLYDDIPYFEVGGAFKEIFYAKYDTQEEIYDDIMKNLKEAVVRIDAFEFMTSAQKGTFENYDILNKGDLDRWVRMANSLRLRMAMRLCHVKPEVSKAVIKELLADGRLIKEYADNISFEDKEKARAMEITFFRGAQERGGYMGATKELIDMMGYAYQDGETVGNITRKDFDPRLYAIFQPDFYGRYIGVPNTFEAQNYLSQYYSADDVYNILYMKDTEPNGVWGEERLCARYNRKTYFNFDMLFPVLHAPETNLLLAEAAVRWPGEFGSINAADCIKKAIATSAQWYYDTNKSNRYDAASIPALQHVPATATAPNLDMDHLNTYCDLAASRFEAMDFKGKIQFIFEQKFIDMNYLNPYEVYNEGRRIIKDLDGQFPFPSYPNVVFQERLYYPDKEATDNTENFEAVKHKNNHTTPVWWTGRTQPAKNPNGNQW